MTLHITGHADLLATIEAQRREIERLESACESAVVEIDRLRRQLEVRQAASSPIPDGPVVVYGELQGYFGER